MDKKSATKRKKLGGINPDPELMEKYTQNIAGDVRDVVDHVKGIPAVRDIRKGYGLYQDVVRGAHDIYESGEDIVRSAGSKAAVGLGSAELAALEGLTHYFTGIDPNFGAEKAWDYLGLNPAKKASTTKTAPTGEKPTPKNISTTQTLERPKGVGAPTAEVTKKKKPTMEELTGPHIESGAGDYDRLRQLNDNEYYKERGHGFIESGDYFERLEPKKSTGYGIKLGDLTPRQLEAVTGAMQVAGDVGYHGDLIQQSKEKFKQEVTEQARKNKISTFDSFLNLAKLFSRELEDTDIDTGNVTKTVTIDMPKAMELFASMFPKEAKQLNISGGKAKKTDQEKRENPEYGDVLPNDIPGVTLVFNGERYVPIEQLKENAK